jgi:thymidylate synthase ThyX
MLAMRGGPTTAAPPSVRLLEFDPDAERKVVAAALYPHSNLPFDQEAGGDPKAVLDALMADRTNRRQRPPRALEHADYLFEVTANFAAYRDLHRHRMLTQDRQVLGTDLGYDSPPYLAELGMRDTFDRAVQQAASVQRRLERELGVALAQYLVPLAFHVRWYVRANLREVYHLCELRTTPQGHPDYRQVAQEMFRRVQEVHPRLASYARFVDLGPGDELERRRSEQKIDEKIDALNHRLL